MSLAPICLFVYNRLDEAKATIEALQNNFLAKHSTLIIYADGAKDVSNKEKVKAVRNYISGISGFKNVEINHSDHNLGLANSIIAGVSSTLKRNGKVIVLEDDIITTPNFLSFMNQALSHFETNVNVYSISAYSPSLEGVDNAPEYYFHVRSFPWGWATWENRWDPAIFDSGYLKKQIRSSNLKAFNMSAGEDASRMLLDSLSGKNSSWYIRWVFHNYLLNRKALFPLKSKADNTGYDVSGTHCTGISAYYADLDTSKTTNFEFEKSTGLNDDSVFLKFFSKRHKLLFRLKLLFKPNGFKLLYQEARSKLFH